MTPSRHRGGDADARRWAFLGVTTRALPLLLAAACSRPLSEAPVLGGSAEQRELARQTMSAFDRDVGVGRVELRSLRFADGAYAGGYSPGTREIRVAADLPVDLVPLVVRHELCHAVDYQEDLLEDRGTPWDDQVRPLFDSGLIVVDASAYPDARTRRSETFATLCGQGAFVAGLAADRCADDPDDAEVLAEWLLDVVYREAEPVPPGPPMELVGRWEAGFAPDRIEVAPTVDPGVVELRAGRGGAEAAVAVELFGGSVVAGAGPGRPPASVTIASSVDEAVVRSGAGPAVVEETLDLVHLGTAQRLLRPVGDGWERIGDGCVPEVSAVFAADDRAWLAESVGDTIAWGIVAE